MQEIRKRLRFTLDLFFKITTGIVIVSVIYITAFEGIDLEFAIVPFLGQILITAALCAAFNFFFYYDQELSKKGKLLLTIADYVYVNLVVLCCGIWFEWFYLSNWRMLLGMVLGIAVVFIVVTALSFSMDYKTAQKMNEKLRTR